jgi:hypothetical protein
MDPNEALKNIRNAHAALRTWNDAEEWHVDSETIAALASDIGDATESFEALDEWLKRDGFLPADWLAEEDKPHPCVEKGDHIPGSTHAWHGCPALTRAQP